MSAEETAPFRPVEASRSDDLARSMLTHNFQVSDSFASPVALWLAHGRPGLTPMGASILLMESDEDDLALDPGTVGAACLELVGDTVPLERQLYPGMDYVLSTPEPGVYLTVRLGGHVVDRFGYGLPQPLWLALCDEPRRGPTPLGDSLLAALSATLDAIRSAAPEPRPSIPPAAGGR